VPHNSGMPVLIPRRRMVPVALISLAALAGCSGGGGGSSSAPAVTSQAASPSAAATATRPAQSASAVLQSALSALRAGVSVHFSGSATISSQTIAVSQDSAADSGRQAFTIDGKAHANVLVVGGTSYIQGDDEALAAMFGFQPTVASRLAGQWISFRPGDSGGQTNYQAITEGVTLASVAQELDLTGRLTLTAPTVIAGRAVIGVHGTVPAIDQDPSGTTATLYIAASGRPLPVSERLDLHGATATYTFSQWGESLHVTAPPNPVPVTSISSNSSPVTE
jgi:hypothetical protein